MKIISIIMPCHNDESTVISTLKSVEAQSVDNWEMIIVNDGSSDKSLELINEHIQNSAHLDHYQVLNQDNQDQLIAVKNGLDFAKGDYIYILHSDDFFYDERSLERFLDIEASYPGYDAYTGSRLEIDDDENPIREVKTRRILKGRHALVLTYLWLGRNIYIDFAFFKRSSFNEAIKESYLIWNIPYWINLSEKNQPHSLKLFNMDFPLFRYRVYEGNYINSKLGAANVLSGELRCLLNLATVFHIPAYRLQYKLFRLLNKLFPAFNYSPLALNKQQTKLSPILSLVFEKAADPSLSGLPQFAAVLNFFKARDSQNNATTLSLAPLTESFSAPLGNQMRCYNKLCIDGLLTSEHLIFLKTLEKGPQILVCQASDEAKLRQYLMYLGLDAYVQLAPSS